jgi:capsid portal protein
MGTWKANMVNYDLFDNQGIPPLLITLAGGNLTDESFQDLIDLFSQAKGYQSFNKLLILEAEGHPIGFEGKEALPGINVQNLSEHRKEDAMFLKYLADGREEVQKLGFRLPGMFLGISDDANYATAFIIRSTVEEQVFIPQRTKFDEVINKTIVRDITGLQSDLRYKSNGPTLQSVDGIGGLIATLVNSGVFTVNGLISFVNATYGTSIALYESSEAWAEEPIPIALQQRIAKSMPQDDFYEGDDENFDIVHKNEKIYTAVREIERTIHKYALPSKVGCC